MEKKVLNTRISHKIDIEENWNKATNFIPLKGEIIIYDIDANHETRRIKIGDGVKNVIDLDFLALPSNGQVVAPGGNVKPQIQVDWQQNNSSEVDYIKNRPFSSQEILYKLNLPRISELIEWDCNTSVYTTEIEVLSEINPIPENGHFIKVSDNFITYEDLLWSTLTFRDSDMSDHAVRILQFKECQIGVTLTDTLLETLTYGYNEDIYVGQWIISSLTAGEKNLFLPNGAEVIFNVPEPGTYFYGEYSANEHFFISSIIGDIDYDQVIIDETYVDENEEIYIGFQRVNDDYIDANTFFENIKDIKLVQDDWSQELNAQVTMGPIFIQNMIKKIGGSIPSLPDGSWWVPNMLGINQMLPLVACIYTENTQIQNITFDKPGLYFAYIQEGSSEEGLISYIEYCHKENIVPIDKKYLPPDMPAIISGSFLPVERCGFQGILFNVMPYFVNRQVDDINTEPDPQLLTYQLNDPEEIYIYPDGMFNNCQLDGVLFGIPDEFIGEINWTEDQPLPQANWIDLHCKYKLVPLVEYFVDSSLAYRCVKISHSDNLYVMIPMSIGGAGGSTTDDVTSTSTSPISSKGVYNALGNRTKLEFDTEPVANSKNLMTSGDLYTTLENIKVKTVDTPELGNTNPISSEGVYNALGGYRFRVSNTPPTDYDNVDDYTITFVV